VVFPSFESRCSQNMPPLLKCKRQFLIWPTNYVMTIRCSSISADMVRLSLSGPTWMMSISSHRISTAHVSNVIEVPIFRCAGYARCSLSTKKPTPFSSSWIAVMPVLSEAPLLMCIWTNCASVCTTILILQAPKAPHIRVASAWLLRPPDQRKEHWRKMDIA
jgi:hypothetical protein